VVNNCGQSPRKEKYVTAEFFEKIRVFGISRCDAKTTSRSGYLPELTLLWFRGVCHEFSLFLAVFIANFTDGADDMNLFRFNIREIRLFVPLVIPTHLISHQHNSSTRRLHSRITERAKNLSKLSDLKFLLLCLFHHFPDEL
jgi:hypothetical protein